LFFITNRTPVERWGYTILTKMKDEFTNKWITENAVEIVKEYEAGILTIRGLHYRLVARGMTNTINHYKRVVNAMIDARWAGIIDFTAFSDNDREIIGRTKYEDVDLETKVRDAKWQVKAWMTSYYRNKWEGQYYYPEVFIEKKALQGVFESVTSRHGVALGACKGYPSLTFLRDTAERMKLAEEDGRHPIILYFGDYDPSGEDIPRSIYENLLRMGVEVEVRRIALMEAQVVEMKLPPAPIKEGDSRSAAWDGLGQVELDAIDPKVLQRMVTDAIEAVFDQDTYDEVQEREAVERIDFTQQLKDFVNTL
jgi:hypothetical protein